MLRKFFKLLFLPLRCAPESMAALKAAEMGVMTAMDIIDSGERDVAVEVLPFVDVAQQMLNDVKPLCP